MLKALVSRYGLRELDFLRKASSPKLEALGVSSLMPSEGELGKGPDAKISPPPPEQNGSQVPKPPYATRGKAVFFVVARGVPAPQALEKRRVLVFFIDRV